jgi:RsiW-degrading membrane proteinase PrsW (M82 family)
MQQNVIFLLLDAIGLFLIIKWFVQQIKDFKNTSNVKSFFNLKRFKSLLLVSILVGIPLLIVNITPIEDIFHLSLPQLEKYNLLLSLIISFSISFIWLIYIIKLDVFEKEKKRYIVLTLLFSVILTCLSEIPYNIIHDFGFIDRESPIYSFIYSVFGIGFIEETIKFIPFLFILKFTKAINEPYDYIFYASVSALGFSFVENAIYLNNYGLDIINARALYATVAHMTFSSVIAYGIFLIEYKKIEIAATPVFIGFYFLAMLSHGFYDFWLINKAVSNFDGLTTLFFLATVHIWYVMKNNTMNNSNFFNQKIEIDNDDIKIYLIKSLFSLFMFSYLYVAFAWNAKEANNFFFKSIFSYGYIILYLIATLSRFNLIKGIIKPIQVGINILFLRLK